MDTTIPLRATENGFTCPVCGMEVSAEEWEASDLYKGHGDDADRVEESPPADDEAEYYLRKCPAQSELRAHYLPREYGAMKTVVIGIAGRAAAGKTVLIGSVDNKLRTEGMWQHADTTRRLLDKDFLARVTAPLERGELFPRPTNPGAQDAQTDPPLVSIYRVGRSSPFLLVLRDFAGEDLRLDDDAEYNVTPVAVLRFLRTVDAMLICIDHEAKHVPSLLPRVSNPGSEPADLEDDRAISGLRRALDLSATSSRPRLTDKYGRTVLPTAVVVVKADLLSNPLIEGVKLATAEPERRLTQAEWMTCFQSLHVLGGEKWLEALVTSLTPLSFHVVSATGPVGPPGGVRYHIKNADRVLDPFRAVLSRIGLGAEARSRG